MADSAVLRCRIGSSGVPGERCPSLADYVRERGPRKGATAARGGESSLSSILARGERVPSGWVPLSVPGPANDNCLSNVLVGYALLWEVPDAPTGKPG